MTGQRRIQELPGKTAVGRLRFFSTSTVGILKLTLTRATHFPAGETVPASDDEDDTIGDVSAHSKDRQRESFIIEGVFRTFGTTKDVVKHTAMGLGIPGGEHAGAKFLYVKALQACPNYSEEGRLRSVPVRKASTGQGSYLIQYPCTSLQQQFAESESPYPPRVVHSGLSARGRIGICFYST